jgi:hypothetical protein
MTASGNSSLRSERRLLAGSDGGSDGAYLRLAHRPSPGEKADVVTFVLQLNPHAGAL